MSQMAATSMSARPWRIRKIVRPVRPKPMIPTRIALTIPKSIAPEATGGKRKHTMGPNQENRMRIRIILASLAAALAAASLSAQPKLNPVERRMMEYVDAHQAEAEVLLERVVNVNSGTMNFEGVREVGKIFRAEFDKIGFKTTWVDGAAFHRAGHLVAEHAGPGPKVLLIGHLDTVFEKDSPFQKFERLPGGKVKGPG